MLPPPMRRIVLTVKGKARKFDLSKIGLPGLLNVNIITHGGHKQVELEILDKPGESAVSSPQSGDSLPAGGSVV